MVPRKSTVDCLVYKGSDLAVVDVVSEVRGEPSLFPILNMIGLQWDLALCKGDGEIPHKLSATFRGVESWLNNWHSHGLLWSA